MMKVEYVDHMGSDLSVVNSARVSFDRVSFLEEGGRLSDNDRKLIEYLARHNHWTPFGHTSLSIRIKAPIFVARQLGKHQVGLVWNEVSRRYVDSEPELYTPEVWRGKPVGGVKQGSSEIPVDLSVTGYDLEFPIRQLYVDALNLYEGLIQVGVAPEMARMVLPQSMYTEWIWTGSIAAFARVCKLRLDPHTQKETREIAEKISAICKERFPFSWEALMR